MKKSTIILLIIMVFLFLCVGVGCVYRKNHPTSFKPVSIAIPDTQVYYDQKDVWSVLNEDASGNFQTGFYFIDIDLDGKKELSVQYGGDTTNNCKTYFYGIEDGNVVLLNGFDDDYSIAVANLEKYIDENGNLLYLNRYLLKDGDNNFDIYYDKILPGFRVEPFLATKDVYENNEFVSRDFFIGTNKVSMEEYNQEANAFFDTLEKDDTTYYFIPYHTWKDLSEDEQIEVLEKAYSISKSSYAEVLKDELIKPIDINFYPSISTTLTDAVYGNELVEFRNVVGGEVSANVVSDKKSFVYVMPATDMLDNMIFYYQDSIPVAYVREFSGIGGRVIYYFQNHSLQSIDKSEIEPDMEFTPEDGTAILIKAESAWSEYGCR